MALKTRHLKCIGGSLDGQSIDVPIGSMKINLPDTSNYRASVHDPISPEAPPVGMISYDVRTISFRNALGKIEYLAPPDLHNFFALKMVLDAYNPERATPE